MSPHQRGQHKKTLGGNLLFNRDSIKGLKLRHFGKLNSTYSNKLWQLHLVHCGSYIYSCYAAVDERLIFSLVYCGSSTAAAVYDKLPQQKRNEELELSTAALCLLLLLRGKIGAPQFESFYTVPFQHGHNFIHLLQCFVQIYSKA